jgi:hypothetical protein
LAEKVQPRSQILSILGTTVETAFATPNHATQQMEAGDTLYLVGGVYSFKHYHFNLTPENTPTNDDMEHGNIVIAAYPESNEPVVIDAECQIGEYEACDESHSNTDDVATCIDSYDVFMSCVDECSGVTYGTCYNECVGVFQADLPGYTDYNSCVETNCTDSADKDECEIECVEDLGPPVHRWCQL